MGENTIMYFRTGQEACFLCYSVSSEYIHIVL